MPNVAEEIECVRQAGVLMGRNLTNLRDATAALGPGERGIDVVLELEGRTIGVQHTIYHFDEGQAGRAGSKARAIGETIARTTGGSTATWVAADYRPALKVRIDEKIAIAARHDNRKHVAETWLVVSSQLPRFGAAAATMMMSALVDVTALNRFFHADLAASKFERVFLVLHLERVVFGWDRTSGWKRIAYPEGRE